MKKLEICSVDEIIEKLMESEKIDSWIISIRDPASTYNKASQLGELYKYVDGLSTKCKGMFTIYFSDVYPGNLSADMQWQVPTEEQIASILEWARDKDDIIVHCTAGISRSSAIAYLISCTDRDPEEALRILDMLRHDPNSHIVKLGSKILNNPRIIEVQKAWDEAAQRAYSTDYTAKVISRLYATK